MTEPDLGGLKLTFSAWKERVAINRARGLPEVEPIQWSGKVQPLCICASGPSLREHEGALRRLRKNGARLMAVNLAYPFLARRGLVPDLFAAFDPDEAMVAAVAPKHPDTFHLIASQMHPKVFDALDGAKLAIWHAYCAGFNYSRDGTRPLNDDAGQWHSEWGVRHVMCMGSHIGMHALALATFLGHFDLHLFGFDGYIRKRGVYAFRQARASAAEIEIDYEGRTYRLDPPLALQAQEFTQVARIVKDKVSLTFHGHSLLGAIWKKESEHGRKAA